MSLILKHRRKKSSHCYYYYNLETIRKKFGRIESLSVILLVFVQFVVSSPSQSKLNVSSLLLETELLDLEPRSEVQLPGLSPLVGKEVPINALTTTTSLENCTNCQNKLHKKEDPLSFDHILRSIFSDEVLNDNHEDWPMDDDDEDDDESSSQSHHVENEKVRGKSLFPLSRGRSIGRRDSESFEERRKPSNKISTRPRDKNNQFNKRRVGVTQNKKNDKRGPNKRNNSNNNGNGSNTKGKGKIDLSKYNAYMDAVLKKMNSLIRKKRMDPLRVNLYAGPSNANKKAQNSGSNNKKKTSPRSFRTEIETVPIEPLNDDSEDEDSGIQEDANEQATRDVLVEQRNMRALQLNDTTELKNDKETKSEEARAKSKEKQPETTKSKESVESKDKKSASSKEKVAADTSSSNEERAKKKNQNSPRPTRGILHGLSTLRRDGNVQVIKDGERARIVRAKFLLGPVGLEIMPRKRKGGSSSSSSREEKPQAAITANAPQLKGILEIRLTPNKPTRIRKLRVFPPGKVEVDKDQTKNSSGEVNLDARRGGMGYRKVTPMATARLRQAAVQVVRQVDNKMKIRG